jgi:hypothetical protein
MEFKVKNEYIIISPGYKKVLCRVKNCRSIEQKRGLCKSYDGNRECKIDSCKNNSQRKFK